MNLSRQGTLCLKNYKTLNKPNPGYMNDIFKLNTDCVPPTIPYHLYFLRISEVWSMFITGQWGEFRVKNATFMLTSVCNFQSMKSPAFY